MNWKHLKSADCSTETVSQSMSVTQAGKFVKFLLTLVVLETLMMPDSQRLRHRVTSVLLIFNFEVTTRCVPSSDFEVRANI